LILSGNTLYGTAYDGGTNGNGTVFAVNTNGTGFTNLHTFSAGAGYFSITNSDGANPNGGLILSGNTLYGTAGYGGTNGNGTVFAVNTDGTGFTNLYTFTANGNSDGVNPNGGLILSGNTLYGTAYGGGTNGSGTVFAVNTDGTDFTTLHSFNTVGYVSYYGFGDLITNSDGANPYGGLILSGSTLYGTASVGGTNGIGTVFALSLPVPPSMRIATAGNKIVLSWPTNATSFTLQSITNLSSGSWSNVTSGIVTVGTNYVFTNTVNGNASFFRLMQ
jgi:uncharacterized repeat protein (TIGR03803 family)